MINTYMITRDILCMGWLHDALCILQISYASSVDTLSNRDRFPNFWRTHTTESNLAASVIAVMKQYGWNMLKIITEDQSLFTEVRLAYLQFSPAGLVLSHTRCNVAGSVWVVHRMYSRKLCDWKWVVIPVLIE